MTDRLESNGYNLDLAENIPVPINLSIADIKEPSKRKRNFSKSIKLPGTMNNMTFFSGTFSFSVTDNNIAFDATLKAPAIFYKRGLSIMPNAVIKLNSIKMTNGSVDYFDCQLYSETIDYFLLLNQVKISELGWSEYDHNLTQAAIVASWSTAIGSGYCYPLIERGLGRPGTTIFRTTDLVPYVYHKEVIDKMFEWLGITFSSTFLNTTRYKSKLFGYGGGSIKAFTESERNERLVNIDAGVLTYSGLLPYPLSAEQTGILYQFTYSFTKYFNPFLDSRFTKTITQDNLGQWNNGTLTIQKSGNYNLAISMLIGYTFNHSGLFGTGDYMKLTVSKNNFDVLTMQSTSVASSSSGTFTLAQGGVLALTSGDVLTFNLTFGLVKILDSVVVIPSLDLTTFPPITIDLTSTDTELTDGSSVELHRFLPDMKCSDFLISEITQHNLYLSDLDDDGLMTIEPLSGYYQGTDTFDDWSGLIDQSKDVVIKPSANEFNKIFSFAFKENKDQDALTYLEKYKNQYGDYNYEQGSYYAKGVQKLQLKWSTIVPYEIALGILIPRFIKIKNGIVAPEKGEPRTMMYNGLKTGAWTLKNASDSTSQELTTYPSVHHFDDWQDPTFDLNFQLVDEVFYTANAVTTINSFSEYYFEIIQEMTSPAGKIIIASVKLNPLDIKNIDFSKFKMINGTLFRLNEVMDFDDNIVSTTKCELIKVLEAKTANTGTITIPFPTTRTLDTGSSTSPSGVGEDVGVIDGGLNSTSQNSSKLIG